jgi:hypothetical protein
MSDVAGSMRGPIGFPEPDPWKPTPTGADTAGAALRLENPVFSILSAMDLQREPADPNHNPLSIIRGTKYETRLDDFLGARNESDTRSLMAKIDREEEDQRILGASGGAGIVAALGAGLLDPTNLIPVIGWRRGLTAAQAAGRVGLSGALGAGVSEAALQASQVTRTLEDSAVNVATATLLSAIIGGGAARYLEPRALAAAEADLERVRAETVPPEMREPMAAPDGAPAAPREMQPLAVSTGAAAADARSLEQLTPVSYGLDKLPVVGEWFKRTSPTLRVMWNETSVSAKRAIADLVELAPTLRGNLEGMPTNEGGALERTVKQERNRLTLEAQDDVRKAWVEHYYGENAPSAPVARGFVDDLRGQAPEGKMTYTQFKEAVAVAAWNGDKHPDPFVARAAADLRNKVFEPIRKMAIDAGLATEDMLKPKGDESFFPRLWNKQAVAAQRPTLRNVIGGWLEGEQAVKAAIKDRLSGLADDYAGHLSDIDRLEGRLASAEQRMRDLSQRLDERGMEARRTEARASTLQERQGEIAEALSELDEFISTMRAEARDPEMRARLADMEAEAKALRNEAARPMSQAEIARLDREDVARVLPGEARDAALLVVRGKAPKAAQSLISHIRANGGIFDPGGDVKSIIGGPQGMPGLITAERRGKNGVDDWGEALFELSPQAWGGERPTVSQVLEAISESASGRDPWWWREYTVEPGSKQDKINVAYDALSEFVARSGADPKSLRDVAALLMQDDGVLDSVTKAIGARFDAANQASGATAAVAERRAVLAEIQTAGARARASRDTKAVRERVEGARGDEAASGARVNRGRLGLLQDRVERWQGITDMYRQTIDLLDTRANGIRKNIETEVKDWKGNSAAEAITALEKRAQADEARMTADAAGEYKGRGDRLRSADSAVDRAVRRIIEGDQDLSRQELDSRADEIIDRILGGPDGRLPYDAGSGGPNIGATGNEPPARGSLASRDFAIPTNLVSDFVEKDVDHVVSGFLRTMLPDIALHQKFGDVEMRETFRKINEEFSAKAAGLRDEKQSIALEKERQGVIRDVAAMRDRFRNVYAWNADSMAQNAARFAGAARNYNVVTDLGTAALNSMPDLAGSVFRYGFQNVFRDAWTPWLASLAGNQDAKAFTGRARQQSKDMVIAIETVTNLRSHQMADMLESYRPGTPWERGLQWMADKSQLVNGQAWWTDINKTMVSTMAHAEILRASRRAADNKASAKDIAFLAQNGIDQRLAARIDEQFRNGGGESFNGTPLANTADWSDRAAARALENAIARESDIAVVTPGQERALWMSRPVAGLLGQFKGFVAATHERTLIAQLQQRDARTLQGLVFSVALGMLSYKLYTLVTGQATSDRPQDWIKEGLSRSPVLGWLGEANSMTAKLTRGQVDAYRLIGADKPLTRYASRSVLSAMLGPTAGKIEGIAQVGGALATMDASAGDISAGRRLIPFQNLFYLRNILNEAEAGVVNAFGIEPKQPR